MKRSITKGLLSLLLFALGLTATAQNLRGTALKAALHDLIQPIRVLKYGSGTDHTWSGFYRTDRIAASPEEGEGMADGATVDTLLVRDRYSNEQRHFSTPTASVSGMHIEHIWANSWWGHVENEAYKDLFNLYPADGTANMRKSNNPIGVVDGEVAFDNGVVKVGRSSSYRADSLITAWEPADQWKGDFARTYFYMATCYSHMTDLWTTSDGLLTIDPASPLTMRPWVSRLMLEWAELDPVDDIEVLRADSIEAIQGNRNPFVDFPGLCHYIWGDSTQFDFDVARYTERLDPTIHIQPDVEDPNKPIFSVSPAMAVLTATPGEPSTAVKVSVYLDRVERFATTVTAEAPLQVSQDGQAWGNRLSLYGGSQTFYARFGGVEEEGDYLGEVVVSCEGLDDRIVELSCNVDAAKAFFENFETGSKTGYAVADVQCAAAKWQMCNALLAGDDNKRDAKCVRMKGCTTSGGVTTPAYIMMVSDKAEGCDSLWFYAGRYGSDTGVKMTVSYSQDGGETWKPIVSQLEVTAMKRYGYRLDVKGNVRLKFENCGSGNKRVNIDDIQMSNWRDSAADGLLHIECERPAADEGQPEASAMPAYDLSGRPAAIGKTGKKNVRNVIIRNGKCVISSH